MAPAGPQRRKLGTLLIAAVGVCGAGVAHAQPGRPPAVAEPGASPPAGSLSPAPDPAADKSGFELELQGQVATDRERTGIIGINLQPMSLFRRRGALGLRLYTRRPETGDSVDGGDAYAAYQHFFHRVFVVHGRAVAGVTSEGRTFGGEAGIRLYPIGAVYAIATIGISDQRSPYAGLGFGVGCWVGLSRWC